MSAPLFQAPVVEPTQITPQGDGTDETPPWGDDFDPSRAWHTIQQLREVEKEAVQLRKSVMTPEQKSRLDEYDRLIAASKSDLEQKTEELTRWQSDAQKWRATAVSNRIEALAGQDFVSLADATKSLADPSKYIDAGGVVDDAAIKADLAAVLEANPHYRRTETASGPRVPARNAAQGAAGAPTPSKEAAFASIIQGLRGS